MDSSSAKTKVSSSSSPSIHCKQTPKSKNSETGDIMWRSFRGNPFPADLSRRNSVGGRESNRLDFGDKENHSEKEQISNVFRAPKVVKNFMSPTISAVSKINPSPRKKILSDKNEVSRSFDKSHHQVRSSVSFSDVISFIGEDKDHERICIDEKKQLEEEPHDITVTDMDENRENKGNDDSSPLPPPVSYSFPVFESREVDQPLAPYDPKKNYLSPRPQFLHYRPNPRIEHRFDECKQLEELFISESSSSETDLSAEETQQEEQFASQEGVIAVEEETQDEEGEESLEQAENNAEEEVVGESIEEETHQVSTQSRFKASKLLGWTLALGVAYLLLVSSTTFSQPNIIKDSPFYEFHISPEIIKSARDSFEQLSVKLRMLAQSSLLYLDKLISSLREEEEYGHFQFYNLTDSLEGKRLSDTVFQQTSSEISVAELFVHSQYWSLEMDIEGETVGHQEPEEPENSCEISLEVAYEEYGNEIEQESKGGEVNYSEMVYEFDTQSEIKVGTDTDMEGGKGYSEHHSEEGKGGQEADDVEGQRGEYEENDQKNIKEDHESETRSAQNDMKNMEEVESLADQLEYVKSAAFSGHQQKETEIVNAETVSEEKGIAGNGGQETDGVEEQSGVYEENDEKNIEEGHEFETRSTLDDKNMEEVKSDAQHLEDVESSTVSGHQQKQTEMFKAEPISEEEETAGNSFVSEETTDVEHDGNDLQEESGFGEVVNDAGSEDFLLSNEKRVMILFSTVMVLLAAASASFLLAKKKAKPVMLLHEDCEPTTIFETNIKQIPIENLIKERLSSLNFQEEEVDDDRKREVSSLPSEMSFSFHKNNSFRRCNNRDDLKEYQSGGGGGGRKSNDSGESMASSASEYSIGSVSYGSFTTYEKIQKRSGHKEKEMITPVRRSSRIRNSQQ